MGFHTANFSEWFGTRDVSLSFRRVFKNKEVLIELQIVFLNTYKMDFTYRSFELFKISLSYTN